MTKSQYEKGIEDGRAEMLEACVKFIRTHIVAWEDGKHRVRDIAETDFSFDINKESQMLADAMREHFTPPVPEAGQSEAALALCFALIVLIAGAMLVAMAVAR